VDAKYFIAWIDRLEAGAAAHPGWNSSAERTATLESIRQARAVFQLQLEQ
jgi:hypothetical protein